MQEPSIGFFDVVTQLVVPILTFVIGVLITLVLKAREQRRQVLLEHAKLVIDLTAAWYRQLDALRTEALAGATEERLRKLELIYTHNREVLPQLVFSRNVLAGFKQSAELTKTVDDFLAILTEQTPSEPAIATVPSLLWYHDHAVGPTYKGLDHFHALLTRLDKKQQEVVFSASSLLRPSPPPYLLPSMRGRSEIMQRLRKRLSRHRQR